MKAFRLSLRILLCTGLLFFAAGAFAKDLDSGVWDLTSQIEGKLDTPKSPTNRLALVVVDFTDLNGKSTQIGKLMAEELTTRFTKSSKVQVIERRLLKKIIDENKLALSGVVDEDTAMQIGKVVGAAIICSGTVTELYDRIRVNARVIKADTGELISTAETEIQDKTLDSLREKDLHKPVKPVRRSEESAPRRINSIGSVQLPRTIPDGAIASRVVVYDGGMDAGTSIGFFGSLSIGVSENLDGLLGNRDINPYIPSLSIKFNLINDINSFNLAVGYDEFAYGNKAVFTNTVLSNGSVPGLPLTIQGFYLVTGWSFSLFGEADEWGVGVRFPVLPVEAIGLANTSLFAGAAVGMTRYFVLGVGVENIYIGEPENDITGTFQFSFIPINDIDITIAVQVLPFAATPTINRILSFGYEYAF
jgi:TolB-like protein